MKQKSFYAYFITLIVILLAAIFFSRKIVKIQPAPLSPAQPQKELVLPQKSFRDTTPASGASYRPAITVIKPANPPVLRTPSPSVPEAKAEERKVPAKHASGITVNKAGKHPTPKQRKEMNQRGIVMY